MTDHLRLVCLDVRDEDAYARYRAAMEPLLSDHGGRFVLDIVGGEARISPASFPGNRVLLIAFPNAAVATRFFAHPSYVEARARFFDPAVAQTLAVTFG